MSFALEAIRNLWPTSTQNHPNQQREQQKATTARRDFGTEHKLSPSPFSQEEQKLARARVAVRDSPRGSSSTTTHRNKARTPQGFSETRVWMMSRSLSTRRRAEAQLKLRRDEAESRLLAENRSWTPAGLMNFGLKSRSRQGAAMSSAGVGKTNDGVDHDSHPSTTRTPRIPSFQWTKDGSFGAAMANEIRLCGLSLSPPEDDDDEVEKYFLSQRRSTWAHEPPQLSKPLPPLPTTPTASSTIATPPAHLDAIVPSTAIQHLAAYLSLPASLPPLDVVEHVLARPNLRAAVARLRAADADLFNSMPWGDIVSGAWDDDSCGTSHSTPCCPETQQAWARLHARNAANKHRRRRQQGAVAAVAVAGADQDLFPLERRRDQKRRLAAHGKAWQRGSARVTGPAALYRVHDGLGCAPSSAAAVELVRDAAPGREELVDDVLSWTRPGGSKLREVVVVGINSKTRSREKFPSTSM
ncbi:hypothetical protein OOU_Y34scaffold00744g26 [Pyricularia oryzae Y34]|uniref:Uncharacterized protein n=1 Tax=Pyricularia oryzae (strain Y34) TaxID=1143189 RepID=A0AA97PHK6_PYRO3|nr:hypothetical protein OOU_Y34scaffold00744g26 [Pyricularia oryzae Y34]